MIYIGIDTGTKTGVAVWDASQQRFVSLTTVPIHRAMEIVREYQKAGDLRVYVEDARQRRYLPRERSVSEYRGRLMGAGAVKRDASIWEDALTDWGVAFEMVAPHAGATKWNEQAFCQITGYTGRTSNHARDAALLVFGRR